MAVAGTLGESGGMRFVLGMLQEGGGVNYDVNEFCFIFHCDISFERHNYFIS